MKGAAGVWNGLGERSETAIPISGGSESLPASFVSPEPFPVPVDEARGSGFVHRTS